MVLVNFLFADETGIKRRPGLIVSSEAYHLGRQDVVIAAVTGNTERLLAGDYIITKWRQAGLLFPSVATAVIRTIKGGMVARKIGSMAAPDMEAIDRKLRLALAL